MAYDYLIVGAGFTGATAARCLAEAGKRILIIDKRDHIGGNAYDYVNEHGVRIHKYGPHIFHTNSDKVFAFLSRFTEWRPYEHRVLSSVDGKLVPFPINLTTLEMLYGRSFTQEEAVGFLAERVARDWHGGEVKNAEDQIVSQVGRDLFELFFAGYTKKMWGRDARDLDRSVTARIPVRFNRDDRYFTDKHQAMPKDGYAALFERMLDHPNIEIALGPRGHVLMLVERATPVIWTGPIDDYFGQCLGPLPYRSIDFVTLRLETMQPGLKYQKAPTINYPGDDMVTTRQTEWSWLTGIDARWKYMTAEYPTAEGDPYYPVPYPEARALYRQYEALADSEHHAFGHLFLGRLGTYQYLNMDQAVGQALAACERLLSANPAR